MVLPAIPGLGRHRRDGDRHGLFVGHTRSPKQLQDLKKVLAASAGDPNLMAKTLLVRRGDHWEV